MYFDRDSRVCMGLGNWKAGKGIAMCKDRETDMGAGCCYLSIVVDNPCNCARISIVESLII
jgi:hypothetical protein